MLERYLTPIVLYYANKYIKDISADLSFSLAGALESVRRACWRLACVCATRRDVRRGAGGDVILNNLELRLDVLEKEVWRAADSGPCVRCAMGAHWRTARMASQFHARRREPTADTHSLDGAYVAAGGRVVCVRLRTLWPAPMRADVICRWDTEMSSLWWARSDCRAPMEPFPCRRLRMMRLSPVPALCRA